MRASVIISVVCLCAPSLAWSLERELPKPVASGELSQGLAQLRSSVEQMAASNEVLAARNAQLKLRLNQSQAALDKITKEYQELSAAKLKAEAPIPAKTVQIEELKRFIEGLDVGIASVNEKINKADEELRALEVQQRPLDEQMRALEDPSYLTEEEAMSPELAELSQQKQKDKLAILKRISESQAHQVLLQQQILDAQKSIPDSPEAENVHRRNMLQADISRLEAEIEQLTAVVQAQAGQGLQEGDLGALEKSIADLENNRNQLKDLIAQMKKKTRQVVLSDEKVKDQVRLQDHIEELKNEAKTLRLDLEEAEQEMVELDKRKHQLELLLKNQ